MKHSHVSRFLIINTVLAIAVGLFLYLVFRPNSFISILFYRFFSTEPLLSLNTSAFPFFIRYYAGDFLWAYALSMTCILILGHNNKTLVFVIALCVLFEIIIECFQKGHVFPGTFDVIDILVEAIATLLSVLIIKLYIKRQNGGKNEKHQQ